MIVGAGLAGLITAHMFPQRAVVERAVEPEGAHKALLRFRSDAIGRITGIDFRPVTVRKGIWSEGGFAAPNIRLANHYTDKCLGRLQGERSIWSLEPVTRWIAPESFYEQLLDSLRGRIQWGVAADFTAGDESILSTAPLPVVLRALGIDSGVDFSHAEICVQRYRVFNADVHQTVYFPDPDTPIYRASITGNLLIVEGTRDTHPDQGVDLVMRAMGLPKVSARIDSTTQRYGKIAPIDDGIRKALLGRLTTEHNIFSIGRFATWRNLLLDDLPNDAAVIKRLMKASAYERRMARA